MVIASNRGAEATSALLRGCVGMLMTIEAEVSLRSIEASHDLDHACRSLAELIEILERVRKTMGAV